MVHRHHNFLAALVLVGSMICPARQCVCRADEDQSDVPYSFVNFSNRGSASSGPAWPRTWEIGPAITFRLRGRIDTDAIASRQSPANEATFGEFQDVVGLRRARIGAEGDLGDDGRYVAEIDLGSGEVVPRDVCFALGDRKEFGESQFGHFREPFRLEGGTSARYFSRCSGKGDRTPTKNLGRTKVGPAEAS